MGCASESGKCIQEGSIGSSIEPLTTVALGSNVSQCRAAVDHCRRESGGGERSSLRRSESAVISMSNSVILITLILVSQYTTALPCRSSCSGVEAAVSKRTKSWNPAMFANQPTSTGVAGPISTCTLQLVRRADYAVGPCVESRERRHVEWCCRAMLLWTMDFGQ